jgi:hypothetical protein
MLYLLLSDKLKGRKRIYKKKEGGKKWGIEENM